MQNSRTISKKKLLKLWLDKRKKENSEIKNGQLDKPDLLTVAAFLFQIKHNFNHNSPKFKIKDSTVEKKKKKQLINICYWFLRTHIHLLNKIIKHTHTHEMKLTQTQT